LALHLGMGITAWSPLAMGLLSGKYRETAGEPAGEGRLNSTRTKNILGYFTRRNFRIAEVLREVATQMGRTSAQVAINWVANRPAVASVIIGASKLSQLDDNLGALEFEIPPEFSQRLDDATRNEPASPYVMFLDPFQDGTVNGGACVGDKPPSYRGKSIRNKDPNAARN
jgi:aryl-alcohol dehydrogenase-like predicted oxidoreductase